MTLLTLLNANDAFIRSRYSKRRTLAMQGDPPNLFTLHTEKIIQELYTYLTSGGEDALAWWSQRPVDRPQRGFGEWLALHPVLGEAILATKAIAIAEDSGLNIVTDSDSIHHNVVFQKQESVFEQLLGKPSPPAPTPQNNVEEIAEIVISTSFDVTRFSAKDIADLLLDGKDLRRFKDALVPLTAHIPPMTNLQQRQKRLRDAAAEAVNEWEKYKRSLPCLALNAISDASATKLPDSITSALLGTGTAVGIGVGAGIGIFLISYSGLRVWRKYREQSSSPYSYLSRIQKLQKRNQPTLTLPPIVYPGM